VTKIYIPYGTTEGQTAKIAEYIADIIRGHGHEAHTADIKRSGYAVPDGYDAVIVGASIHMGKHNGDVRDLVRKNLAVLERLPSAFFSVSLAAHGDSAEAESYVEEFEQDTGWRPATVALFGGALLYTEYGFVKRHVMKKIARDKPGNLGTDTSRDYVYTEWDGVRRLIRSRRGSAAAMRTPTACSVSTCHDGWTSGPSPRPTSTPSLMSSTDDLDKPSASRHHHRH
jgi:menaquinone-dependent protoporphyrinogen oxidase